MLIKIFNKIKFYFFYFLKIKFFRKYQISSYNIKFCNNFLDLTFIFYLLGSYNDSYFVNYLKNIKKKSYFIDVGANQGLYSIIASKNNNILHSYLFEPQNSISLLLKKNLQLNKIYYKCKIFKMAISDKNAYTKITLNKFHTGKSTINDVFFNSNHEIIQTVNSSYLNKKLNLNKNIILKIDVEGHDYKVLLEMIKTKIFKQISAIYIEYNSSYQYRQIKKSLIKYKFKLMFNNNKDLFFHK
jgi:FkbM family methyltransferase